jgi:hypothetical protein
VPTRLLLRDNQREFPMRFESKTTLAILRLQQSEEDAQLLDLRNELEAIRLHLKARREEKFSPDQPRDWHGRWTSGGGEGTPGDEGSQYTLLDASGLVLGKPFGATPDGTPVEDVGGFDDTDRSKSVQQFISEKCLASVGRRVDGAMLYLSIEEMLGLAALGDPMAVRCKKILGQDRFRK